MLSVSLIEGQNISVCVLLSSFMPLTMAAILKPSDFESMLPELMGNN